MNLVMISKIAFSIIYILILSEVYSQNLIQNGSFELYEKCPDAIGQLNLCQAWWTVDGSSPEYFHGCYKYIPYKDRLGVPENHKGYRFAADGEAYVGLVIFNKTDFSFREYLQTKLLSGLQAGKKYRISAWVSLADSSLISGDMLSFCFSENKDLISNITKNPLCSCKNKITIRGKEYFNKHSWVQISAEFIATGNEQYLTVGTFKEDYSKIAYYFKAKKYRKLGNGYRGNKNSSYLYIDNIELIAVDTTVKENIPRFRKEEE